jgi:hypothetical protein
MAPWSSFGSDLAGKDHRDLLNIELVSRRSALQVKVLRALHVDTSTWDKATIA